MLYCEFEPPGLIFVVPFCHVFEVFPLVFAYESALLEEFTIRNVLIFQVRVSTSEHCLSELDINGVHGFTCLVLVDESIEMLDPECVVLVDLFEQIFRSGYAVLSILATQREHVILLLLRFT